MRGVRGAWAAAGALGLLAVVLALSRRRDAPPPSPAPAPLPERPAPFDLAQGRLDGPRALERSLLVFPDGIDAVLREGSEASVLRRGDVLLVDLREGRIFVDAGLPGADVRIRTPHAEILAPGACVDVRSDPAGTAVTVAHGAVTVAGTPFRMEITRDETLDVAPDGALGVPMRIDPAAWVRWAGEAVEGASRLRDGGFEEGFGDGHAGGTPVTPVRLDRHAHAGRRCVLVELNTARTVRHEGPVSGPVELPPGSRIRFRGYVQHQDLDGGPDGGFYLEVRDAGGAAVARTPLYRGVQGWRKFSVDFTAPSTGGPYTVAGRTVENGAALQGRVRIDDLAIWVLGF